MKILAIKNGEGDEGGGGGERKHEEQNKNINNKCQHCIYVRNLNVQIMVFNQMVWVYFCFDS